MKAVDKLICNELASRKSVVLPDVGTLVVERIPAAETGRNVISAPVNRVSFSTTVVPGQESIIDIVADMGIERSRAEEVYRQWLSGARAGDEVRIEGAGTISRGQFIPTNSLEQVLNPIAEKSVNLHDSRRCTPWWAGILIPLLFVVLGILAYHFIVHGGFCHKSSRKPIPVYLVPSAEMTVAEPAISTATAVAGEPEVIIEPAASDTMVEEALTEAVPAQESLPEPVSASQTMYYVVAGTFDIEKNADNFIRLYKNAYPDVDPVKVPYKDNKFVVSIYSSPQSAQAERMAARYRHNHFNPDLWVYKSE